MFENTDMIPESFSYAGPYAGESEAIQTRDTRRVRLLCSCLQKRAEQLVAREVLVTEPWEQNR